MSNSIQKREIPTLSGSLSPSIKKISAGTLDRTFINGLSAYEIAVKHGYSGSEEEWLESIAKSVEFKEENGIVYYRFSDSDGSNWIPLIDTTDFASKEDIDNLITISDDGEVFISKDSKEIELVTTEGLQDYVNEHSSQSDWNEEDESSPSYIKNTQETKARLSALDEFFDLDNAREIMVDMGFIKGGDEDGY